MKRYLLAALVLFFTIGAATLAAAQDSDRKDNSGISARGQSGDTKFDIQVQKGDQQPPAQGPEGRPGPQGTPGPQGAPGPSGSTTVMGMDPTVALLVGLGVLAVVIVAIIAASRGREV